MFLALLSISYENETSRSSSYRYFHWIIFREDFIVHLFIDWFKYLFSISYLISYFSPSLSLPSFSPSLFVVHKAHSQLRIHFALLTNSFDNLLLPADQFFIFKGKNKCVSKISFEISLDRSCFSWKRLSVMRKKFDTLDGRLDRRFKCLSMRNIFVR